LATQKGEWNIEGIGANDGSSTVVWIWLVSARRGYRGEQKHSSGGENWRCFLLATLALCLTVNMVDGIRFGIFKATEVG
jgi:TRAP-type C4-dicarboxylate transport system permease large subunit